MTTENPPIPLPVTEPILDVGGSGPPENPSGRRRFEREGGCSGFGQVWHHFWQTCGAVIESRAAERQPPRLGVSGSQAAHDCADGMNEPWFAAAAATLREEDLNVFASFEAELRFYAWRYQRIQGASGPAPGDEEGESDYGPADGEDDEGADSGSEISQSVGKYMKRWLPEKCHDRFDKPTEIAKLLRPLYSPSQSGLK